MVLTNEESQLGAEGTTHRPIAGNLESEFKMIYAIIVAIVVAGLSGLPVMPVFIVGALVMLGTAYRLSRSDRLLNIGAAYLVTIAFHYSAAEFNYPAWLNFASSDTTLYAISGAVMVLAAAIGIFAPLNSKSA